MLKLSSLNDECTFDAQKICGFYGPTSENELANASPFCEWEAFVQKIPHLCRTHDDEKLRSLISNIIPPNIGKCIERVCLFVGLHTPPAISYAATVLFNWKKKDAEKQIDCDNFEIVSTFTATADERCFYLVPLRIECLGSAAFNAARTFFATIEPKIDIFAKNYVELCAVFEAALQRATDQLKLMHDGCNPKVFFQKVRGFLKGSWKNPQLPRGVCVGERWFQAPGASASQSPFIHLCDAFVGVAHDDPYSCLIRQILPAEIGDLLAAIECHCVYFRLLIAANPQTKVALGRVADLLVRFRKMHFGLAQRYVLHPSLHAKAAENEAVEFCAEIGTGGVEVVAFLEERRLKTAAALNEIHSPN